MTGEHSNLLEYKPPEKGPRLKPPVGAIVLAVAGPVWFWCLSISLYFLSPNNWHFFVYDHIPARALLFCLLALPSLLSFAMSLVAIVKFCRRSAVNLVFGLVLAAIGILLSVPCILWIFWNVVISPLSPYGPGYWI